MIALGLQQISPELWKMPQPLGNYAGELLKRGRSYHQAFQILAERSAVLAQLQFAADTQHLRGSKIQWSD
ncbi:hypothetical protein [Mesorhizobium sp.]|uniref:hypothetical protein n=1 Tax=Mesorhizobium sp. TaxID=1871066 RepID=UPI000FEA9444|nr:hypothetical protein [Mesorhizobium sp.]RWH31135.1 MAG: hypothetical protein EOQ76_09725 [Mesorhizobium sp.]RWH39584.1 MAG: hypothetical protein EOQ79_07300 [Mesorhizobium sp.]TIM67349.1 MAG: hypothetical protein E5Y52_11830 [Mesorhizobium sp.]TIQ93675.1 MAG: hypothetical protein E5X36_29870 [Mesorhizobium sp.]TIR62342.1 MAG: hypothetical protein E5X22_01045 [Mesorhizobium sp.]